MKKIIFALLGISLAANGWLFFREKAPDAVAARLTASGAPAPKAGTKKVATPSAAKFASGTSARTDSARIAAVLKALVEMDETDLVGARDRLRALGADEQTVFAAVDGVIVLDYYRLQRTTEAENIRNGWWRGNPAGVNPPPWGKLAESKLFEVMGYDPYDIKDFSSRFEFLPPEKAGALSKIAVDYRSLSLRVAEDPTTPRAGASELLAAERRADVVKLLSPEELAEYDLRFSDFAGQNNKRFAKMDATETEYRKIAPLLEQMHQEISPIMLDQNVPVTQRIAAQRAAEQRALDQLVAAVGADRAVDYMWSGVTIGIIDPTTSNLVTLPSIPKVGPVMQLATETGAKAAAIHHDASLTPEAKRAALLALQQATQPKLDQILPAEERANLDRRSFGWFEGLAKGEYIPVSPRLLGNPQMVYSPISVTAPARGAPAAGLQIRLGK